MAIVLAATGASAQAPAPQPVPSATATATPENPNDKVKCRTFPVIGSLAKTVRICKTIAEWRKHDEIGSEAARDIADYSRSRQMGN